MASEVKTLVEISQDVFNDLLNEFGERVQKNEYVKLNYPYWRVLHAWATKDLDSGYFIRIVYHGAFHDFSIRRCTHDTESSVPNPVDVSVDDSSFGSFLWDNWEYISTRLNTDFAFETMASSFNNIADSATSVSNAINLAATSVNQWINDHRNELTIDTDLGLGSSNTCSNTIEINTDYLKLNNQTFEEAVEKVINNLNNMKEKEKKTMKFNFDFGPVDASIRMSMYGMAIKNASGNYVAYDSKSQQIMDVDVFNFEGANKFIYKMPVALRDVRSGDVIIHARKPMFVQMVCQDNRLKVLDIYDGEEKTIVPVRSPFNFDFVTKVVSLVNMNGVASAENPFGNMLPFFLMSDGKMDDMLPLMLMSNNTDMASNPMLMYMVMSKGKNDDVLPFLMMSGMFNQPASGCKCNCNCDHADK